MRVGVCLNLLIADGRVLYDNSFNELVDEFDVLKDMGFGERKRLSISDSIISAMSDDLSFSLVRDADCVYRDLNTGGIRFSPNVQESSKFIPQRILEGLYYS